MTKSLLGDKTTSEQGYLVKESCRISGNMNSVKLRVGRGVVIVIEHSVTSGAPHTDDRGCFEGNMTKDSWSSRFSLISRFLGPKVLHPS